MFVTRPSAWVTSNSARVITSGYAPSTSTHGKRLWSAARSREHALRTKDRRFLSHLMRESNKHHNYNNTLKMWKSFSEKGLEPSAGMVYQRFTALLGEGRHDVVQELLAETPNRYQPKAFLAIIEYHHRQKDWKSVGDAWNVMLRAYIPPEPMAYNLAIHSSFKLGQYNIAATAFQRMVNEGFEPSKETYSSMVLLYNKLRLHREAIETFKIMKEKQHKYPFTVFYAILHSLGAVEKITDAEDLCEAELEKGVADPVLVTTAMISLYSKRGLVEKAEQKFKLLTDGPSKPTKHTYTAMIDAYCNGGNTKEALKLFGEMKEKGIHPDEVTYLHLITMYHRLGMTANAQKLISELDEKGIVPCKEVHKKCLENIRESLNYKSVLTVLSYKVQNCRFPEGQDHSRTLSHIFVLQK